jgi:hypothetical protein
MLAAHMDAVEAALVHTSQIPANTGHTLHRGTPREAFIKQFLENHLSVNVAIGTGEIIDANSMPRSPRNQFDIVIYKRSYPKLDFGGGISGFLVESVVATIEVKSILDQAAIDQSVGAAHNAKSLTPNVNVSFSTGWIPPRVLNFVVAYQGPANMATAHSWILNSHQSKGIPLPSWTQQTKIQTAGTGLDGVFVLQRGFVKLDNSPLSLNSSSTPAPGIHVVCDSPKGTLLMLFLALQEACDNIQGAWLNAVPYVQSVRFPSVKVI